MTIFRKVYNAQRKIREIFSLPIVIKCMFFSLFEQYSIWRTSGQYIAKGYLGNKELCRKIDLYVCHGMK